VCSSDLFKDATRIPMRKVKRVRYNYLGDVDVNNPDEEGSCVDTFLLNHYGDKISKKNIMKNVNNQDTT
jgi:hypothetical protein